MNNWLNLRYKRIDNSFVHAQFDIFDIQASITESQAYEVVKLLEWDRVEKPRTGPFKEITYRQTKPLNTKISLEQFKTIRQHLLAMAQPKEVKKPTLSP